MSFTGISDFLRNNPVSFQRSQSYEQWKADPNSSWDGDEDTAMIQFQGYLKDVEVGNSLASMAFMSFVKLQQEILQDMKSLR